MRTTHFTELVPSHPGTIRRTGNPWISGVWPFMLSARMVAGCRALFIGSERTKSGVEASPTSAPSVSMNAAELFTPAIFSTSLTRGPRHSALPIAPRIHCMPGTLGE